jgi:hypothetical protein
MQEVLLLTRLHEINIIKMLVKKACEWCHYSHSDATNSAILRLEPTVTAVCRDALFIPANLLNLDLYLQTPEQSPSTCRLFSKNTFFTRIKSQTIIPPMSLILLSQIASIRHSRNFQSPLRRLHLGPDLMNRFPYWDLRALRFDGN